MKKYTKSYKNKKMSKAPIKELPTDTQQQVNEGKVTYRGCGIDGKNAGMFKLKVHGKEYIVPLETLRSFENEGYKIRFDAPFRSQ